MPARVDKGRSPYYNRMVIVYTAISKGILFEFGETWRLSQRMLFALYLPVFTFGTFTLRATPLAGRLIHLSRPQLIERMDKMSMLCFASRWRSLQARGVIKPEFASGPEKRRKRASMGFRRTVQRS